MLRRWSSREEILAVGDDYLVEWLDSIGMLSLFNNGEVHCNICNVQIDKDNMQMIARLKGELVFVCNNPICIHDFISVMGGQSND